MLFYVILDSLFSRIYLRNGRRTITASTKDVPRTSIPWFRISESNPAEHNENCLTRIYTIPSDITASLMSTMTLELKKQTKAFRELGILIRRPAVEIISYLEQTDFTKSINKYVLCIL